MNWFNIIKDCGRKHKQTKLPKELTESKAILGEKYHWSDAFNKFGFGDTLDSGNETNKVHEFLVNLGYEVSITLTSVHNDYINHVSKGDEVIYSKNKGSVEQIKENDSELYDKLETEFKGEWSNGN